MRSVESAFWAIVTIVLGSIALKLARERSLQQALTLLKDKLDSAKRPAKRGSPLRSAPKVTAARRRSSKSLGPLATGRPTRKRS